ERRAIRDRPAYRPERELGEVHRAAVDVAADDVPVAALEVGRAQRAPGEDQTSEARSEALDLRLDPFGHVLGPAVRHVALRPGGVLAGRRAGVVEERRLRE